MRKGFAFIFTVLAAMVLTLQASAAPAVSFSVQTEIPDNQVDRSKTYFDLRLKPEEKQTVRVHISNSGQEPIAATVTLNPATTGPNGIILYNAPSPESAGSSVSIMDVARVDTPQVRVEAGSTAAAEITIEMPRESVEGTLLGGLVFTAEKAGAQTSPDSGTGIALQNELDYIVALKISESDAVVSPDFTLLGIEAGQENHRTAVLATLENIRPAIVKGLHVQGAIYRNNSDTVFRELKLTDAEAAPNSSIPLVFDWQNNRVEAGDYLLKLRVEHEGQDWNFERAFAIDSQQADNSNQGAVNIAPANIPGWTIAVIIILAAVLICFLWDKFRRKKRVGE